MNSKNNIPKFSDSLLTFCESKKDFQELLTKLNKFIDLWDFSDFYHNFFANLSISKKDKKEILKNICNHLKFDIYFMNTVFIMIDYGLAGELRYFLDNLKKSIFEALNIKNVYVYSTIQLSSEQKVQLNTYLKKIIEKELLFHFFIDKTLIMGIKIKYDDYTEEYSLASQLKKIEKTLSLNLW